MAMLPFVWDLTVGIRWAKPYILGLASPLVPNFVLPARKP
jgi:hypothetical protein